VLRLANSAHCHLAGSRIDNLEQAVTWSGDRQISELVLALNNVRRSVKKSNCPGSTQTSCGAAALPAVWRSSSSAPLRTLGADEEGLFLFLPSIAARPGTARPRISGTLREDGRALPAPWVVPRQLGTPYIANNSRPSDGWSLWPDGIFLQGCVSRCNILVCPMLSLPSLTEPLRSKVERLRVAELLGQVAVVVDFEPWDEIDFPPSETICRPENGGTREHC